MSPEWAGPAPKYGQHSEMTAVLDIVQADITQRDAVARLAGLYPWRSVSSRSAFVYNARRDLGRSDLASAERRTHAFIHESRQSQPDKTADRVGWTRPELLILLAAALLAAVLVTGVVVTRNG